MSDKPFKKIDSLRPDTTGHTLIVKVLEAKPLLDRPSKPEAKSQKVSECLVGDDTGVILLTTRNDQVDKLQPGTWVKLTNAKVDMFRGNMRLAVAVQGLVERTEEQSWKINSDYNLSLVEYELVHVPKKVLKPKEHYTPPIDEAEAIS